MTTKGFYQYTREDMFDSVVAGTYHLQIKDAVANVWDDGRDKLDINTIIKSGPLAGSFGPRHTWSPRDEDFHGVAKATGREFTISFEKDRAKFVTQVTDIMDGLEVVLTDPSAFDAVMLREIASQLKGREFIAVVSLDDNGYARMGRVYPMSAPPKGFATEASAFNIDEI